MNTKYNGVVVVIPSRNRAGLAINAVRSVLSHADSSVNVLVSDNSTSLKDSQELSNACETIRDTRLRYIKPSKPMAMPDHWEWAIQQALHAYNVNHFIYLSDRNVFISCALKEIIRHAISYPEKVISYNFNSIDDSEIPMRLFQIDWTGLLYELKSSHLIYLASKSKTHTCIPKMLNCIVPRSVLQRIYDRFGSIFDSIAPDYCFAFRCLETVDSIIYYDKAVQTDYGMAKSTGRGCARGILSEGYADFLSNIGGDLRFFATPIPELIISANAKVHEFCLLKDRTNSTKFPNLDTPRYLETMAHAVEFIKNPDLKVNMLKLLEKNGWETSKYLFNLVDQGDSPTRKRMPLIHKLRQLLRSPALNPLWRLSNRLLGIYPSGVTLEFKTVEEAIDYANKYPRKRRSKTGYLMEDLEMPDLKPL